MCAAGTSRRITCRWWWNWTWRSGEHHAARLRPVTTSRAYCAGSVTWVPAARERTRRSIPAALDPALEIDQRQRALVVARLLERRVIELGDPGFLGGGAVARQRQPHQPARHLTRDVFAAKQHAAERGLRLMLALVGGEAEPARRLAGIVRRALSVEIEPRQVVLRIRIAEVGRRIREHLLRPHRVGFDRRVRDAIEVIVAKRDEGVGYEPGLRGAGTVVGVGIGDATEIFEGAQVAALHPVALGIHAAELPLGERVALLGGVLQRRDGLLLLAGAQRLRAGAESFDRCRYAARPGVTDGTDAGGRGMSWREGAATTCTDRPGGATADGRRSMLTPGAVGAVMRSTLPGGPSLGVPSSARTGANPSASPIATMRTIVSDVRIALLFRRRARMGHGAR